MDMVICEKDFELGQSIQEKVQQKFSNKDSITPIHEDNDSEARSIVHTSAYDEELKRK